MMIDGVGRKVCEIKGKSNMSERNARPIKSREPNIGKMLLDVGKITPADAERVLQVQHERGLRFGDAAIALGILTEEDIQHVVARQFHYPYLLPGEGSYSNQLIAAYQPFSEGVEALRMLRAQLNLRWFDHGRKSLVVMSTDQGAGVSYMVANLAVVFSQLGERTLLVDGNLRSPRQHEIFGIRSKTGFADVLAGRSGLDAVAPVTSFLSLSVLPAGTQVPNPQELLNRASFKILSDEIEQNFDTVFYDVPAFSAGADALMLAAKVGGVLVVARKDATRMAGLADMCTQLARAGVEIVGSVLVEF
jgi:chain length determinant protein tyrosine kinase EpsG